LINLYIKLMKYTIKIINFFLLFLIFTFKTFALENKILFKVNNEIITSIDLLSEIEYLKLINENLNNIEQKKLFEIAKNSIIREKIKIIELFKYYDNLEVESQHYKILMNELLKKTNLNKYEDLEKLLISKNININSVEQKIKIEILWNNLIFRKYSKDVKIDKKKIKSDLLKNNFQKEFLLSEIVFNIDNSQKLQTKFNKIKNEIETNGFSNAALVYSISDTANKSGKLGWIKFNSLNSKIKKILLDTEIGQITEPIVIPGGFLILKIENEREAKILNDIDKEINIVANEKANKQLNQFSNIYFNKIRKEIKFYEF
tara:strand:- start:739 stop:1689 length:951 start_codon:yes stop_codon:yes gene_type:complete